MSHRKYILAALAGAGLAASAFSAPTVVAAAAAANLPAARTAVLAKSDLALAALDNPKFLDVAKLPDLAKAAGTGLSQYRSLVDAETFKDMGLPDAGAAEKAVLGTPKRDFLIRLDALRAFKPGGDIEALLVDTRIVHYPVLVDGKTVNSMSLVESKDGWSLVSLGDVQRTSLRKRAIDNSMKRFAKAEEEHFIVRIPALNLEFTAFRDRDDALQLASVSDNPIAGLTAGEAEPAAKVIAKILPLALEDDGLPH